MPLFDKLKEKFKHMKVDEDEDFKKGATNSALSRLDSEKVLNPREMLFPIEPRERRLSQQFPVEYFYTIKETLGQGTFAKVVTVADKNTDEQFAMKIIDKQKLAGRKISIREEISIMRKVSHPNILSLRSEKSIFETPQHFYLVMPLARGGELFQEIVGRGSFTEADARVVMYQILQGVVYLHSQNIVHRDIKPENLLLTKKLPEGQVMITDFGLSKVLANDDFMLKTACGTPAYVAPEVILRKGYGKPCDAWSIGIILYVLLCGYVPFYGETQQAIFYEIVKLGPEFDEEYWSHISADAKDLILKLLDKDPTTRMTMKAALEHKWITSTAVGAELIQNYHCKKSFKKAVNAVRAAKRMQNAVARKDSKKDGKMTVEEEKEAVE